MAGALTLVLPYRFCLAITLYASLSEYLFMCYHNLATFMSSTYTILHRVPF